MDVSQGVMLAKVAGLTSAGVFAGYTWALSRAAVPAIIDYGSGDEKTMLAQWRLQYVDGAAFSRPCCLINAVSFLFLAYHANADKQAAWFVTVRMLYVVAALSSASGVPWALTALRRTNGALSIRSKRLAGLFTSNPGSEPMCITYASNESGSVQREGKDAKYRSTKALIMRWKWHNDFRTALLMFGTIVGAFAIVVDKS